MSDSTEPNQPSKKIIQETTEAANRLYPLAQASFVYRASIAYILQNIKAFIAAIQPLANRQLKPVEFQSLRRFIGIVNHFSSQILPKLNKENWVQSVTQQSSAHVHQYINKFRTSLYSICEELGLNPSKVIICDPMQDAVNKTADFQHLKAVLKDEQEHAISLPNSLDFQQSIDTRLRSIQRHIPKSKGSTKLDNQIPAELPRNEMQQRMNRELSVFQDYDIPCEDLKLDAPLGCGGFGTVYIATRLSTGELLAVKEVRSDNLKLSTWASLYSEVRTMSELRHRYVLELVGAHIKEPYRIITRYCPGKSVFDRLHRSQTPLSPHKLTAIAYQVAEGMRFLHEHGIVHRDLKTMNILLDKQDAAKIADFGLAGMMKDNALFCGGVGTPHYTAPEILERKRYGPKVDVYSYGIILWEMGKRQIPFRNMNYQQIYNFIVTQNYRLSIDDTFPPALKTLIKKCWSQNPNERPEFKDIVEQFKNGELYFQGSGDVSIDTLEIPESCPLLDMKYLTKILSDPNDKCFPSVVDFLETHFDSNLKESLHNAHILSNYKAGVQNESSILLIASRILNESEFSSFIQEIGEPIIKDILANQNPDPDALISAVKFCLRVPDQYFNLVKTYVPTFAKLTDIPGLFPFILRLLARLEISEIVTFKSEIVKFFTLSNILQVNDQMTVDAVCKLISIVADDLDTPQFEDCIPLLEMDYDCPESLIKLLISKTSKESNVRLVLAIIRAASRTDVTDSLIDVLKMCESRDLIEIAHNPTVFDQIKYLIEADKSPPFSVEAALILLFRLSTDEEIPPLLANHPLLHSVLQLKGHIAQRLQIFTALFSVEQFCSDTTISDGVLKLLVSSSNKKDLVDYSIKLIGALSLHITGCTLISVNGMLSIFSQMFLSSSISEMSMSLTILYNIATYLPEGSMIPQLSLIVSCLMQDLIHSSTNKSEILQTLIKLISRNPDGVQEHDLQYAVLPLLSQRQEPVIIVLVLKLLDECEPNKLGRIYTMILYKIYLILGMENLMYPEILSAALSLLATLAMQYNIVSFLELTNLIEFSQNIIEQIRASGKYPSLVGYLTNYVFILEKHSKPDAELKADTDQTMQTQEDDFMSGNKDLKKLESQPVLNKDITNSTSNKEVEQSSEEDEEDEAPDYDEYDEEKEKEKKKKRSKSDAHEYQKDIIETDSQSAVEYSPGSDN